MCRNRQKPYGSLRHLSIWRGLYLKSLCSSSVDLSWRPLLLQLNPLPSASNRMWCNSTGTVGASAISAFVLFPPPVPHNKDVSFYCGESYGQQNILQRRGALFLFLVTEVPSLLTAIIIGKLRGCCVFLLHRSEGHLQLLDQYPLLEPVRRAKEIRKQGIRQVLKNKAGEVDLLL